MEYVHAFWVGGLICAAVQILMDRTKLMPGRIMVLLVCSGAPIWAAGSAITGSNLCFTCTTGEANDSDDYEIE